MHHLSKRLCAILLTLCMVIGFLPMTAQAALVDSAAYVSQQLTLGDDLVLHLLSNNIPEAYQNQGHAELTYPMGMDGKKVTKTYRIEDVTKNGNGYYDVPVERVVAQMADEIELVVKSDLGVEVINQTYSIRDYVTALLDGIYTSQTKNLCFELLNYGAAAQKYFDYNTGNLANEGYEIQPGTAIPGESVDVNVTGEVTGIKPYGTSVVFLSKASVRFYFQADNGVKGYTFTVDGQTVTPREKSGLYFIEVPGINPQDMSDEMHIAVTNGTETLSFDYAPTWFFIRSYHKEVDKGAGSGVYAQLMQTAYSYYMAAEKFAGNSITEQNKLNLTCYTGSANSIQVKTDLAYTAGMTLESGIGMDKSIVQTQYATGVALNNVDGYVALTFSFANGFATGQTYSLPKDALVKISGKEYALAEDYVFAYNADNTENMWSTTEPVSATKLLGFENYTEITGADTGVKLSVGNMLGRMEINADPRYVSEGVASLKVQPQGDYSNPGKHPYIKLDMSGEKYTATYDATISDITTHADFSGYKSISFDVYNPESVAQKIRVGLMIGESSYITTNKQTYTLAPNSWTTCTYDLYIMAGFDFYTLDSLRFIVLEFLNHKESKNDVPSALYIDDLVGNVYKEGESAAYTDYNYYSGVGYETRGQEYLLIGQGNVERDAVIERVAYEDAGISAPTNGGSYAVKLSHDSDYYPTFRIHFGQTLPAGTEIEFDAYGRITSGTTQYNQSIFEYSDGGEATAQFACDQWTKLSMVLPKDGDYVDLFWNIERAGITSATASGEVYIDNFTVIQPEREGNIIDGLGFEKGGNVAFFGASSDTDTDAAPKRLSYASLGITPPANGGEFGLALTHSGNDVTTRLDFGQTLPAGTVISFMAYGVYDGGWVTGNKFEIAGGDTTATELTSYETWLPIEITLNSAASYIDIDWQVNYFISKPSSVTLYIDNLKAVLPAVTPNGDWYDIISFEEAGNEGFFTGQGNENNDFTIRKATYEELEADGIVKPADGGEYALKLSQNRFAYPTLRINLDGGMEPGTVISFQVYVDIEGLSTNDKTKFEYSASSGGGNATMDFACGTWHTVTMTLPSDAEYMDLFLNVEMATGSTDPVECAVYMDNFTMVDGSFTSGVNFDDSVNHTGLFTGQGAANDAVLARVSYADSGITAPANGGEYALKLTNTNNDRWPKFRMNFGEELPAGTLITFDAYSKLLAGEAKYNWSIFEYNSTSGSGDATALFNHGEWTTLYLVLNETTDHLDLFWNIDRAEFTSDTSSAEVYLDNFKAVVPETNASGSNLPDGVNFETAGNSALFTQIDGNGTNNAAITRIPYSLAGITAPANGGGEYALRLSNQSFAYPTFRLNFGTTLTAGTTITFDAYVDYTSWQDISGASSMLAYSGGTMHGQTAGGSFPYEQWKTVSFTLVSDATYLDLFWNVNAAGEGLTSINNTYLYLDNIRAEEPFVTEGDFFEGVGFEVKGNIGLFIANGRAPATIERVAYANNTSIGAPTNGGDYMLKLSHASDCWPTFRIDFGTTLKAGTVITYDVYTAFDGWTEGKAIVLQPSGDTATNGDIVVDQYGQVAWIACGSWKTMSMTLANDCSYVDLFYNIGQANGDTNAASTVYMDNFKAAEPVETEAADFLAGVTFEALGHEESFIANGRAPATIERVAYANNTSIGAPTNGGDYMLKLSHASDCWPTFRIDFGTTLKAGTVITYDVYTAFDGWTEGKAIVLQPSGDTATNGDIVVDQYGQVAWIACGSWKTMSMTLVNDCSYVDLFYNIGQANGDTNAASTVYMDNFKAVEPEDEAADFEAGVTFEKPGHEASFAGITDGVAIQRVSYADLAIDSDGRGDYALAVSHENNCWPNFRINFGKTLPAGTTITFDAYGSYDYVAAEGVNKFIKVELTSDAKTNYAKCDDENQVIWTLVDTWKTSSTITLTADSDHLDLFYNVADGNHGNVSSVLLLDNIKATVPDMTFINGVTFEEDIGTDLFDDSTAWNAATAERVSYADVGLTDSAERGQYALRYSYPGGSAWPAFRINFGKTLPAGTTITFDAYGNYDYVAAAGVNKYMKVQLAGSNATSNNPDQVIWTLVENWVTCDTITLTADSDYLDLFWNVADGNHGQDLSSWLLLDNIKAVEPIGASLGFEFAYQAGYFTGTGNANTDATIERVAYADLGIGAPGSGDGGEYAIKLSHSSNMYPTFRINFGRTVAAGTTLKFDAYGTFENYESGWSMSIHLGDWSKDTYLPIETWMEDYNSLVLPADCTYIDLLWNIERGQITEGRPSFIVLDNIELVEP